MTEPNPKKQARKEQPAPKTITNEEGDKLIKYLHEQTGCQLDEERRIRNTAMGVLMLDAGLRVGELVKLDQPALLLNDEPVNNLYIDATITKTHSSRTIPLTNRIKIAIKEMQDRVWTLDDSPENGHAFYYTYSDKHITVRQVQRIIAEASLAAFGRTITPHILRHTFASRMMRVAPTRVVQQLLGHKSLSSTQIYTHPNGDDLQKGIAALEA